MGVDLPRFIRAATEVPRSIRDFQAFRHWLSVQAQPPQWCLAPVLGDRHAEAGSTSDHYFQQDLWVARAIRAAAPARHVDVGSRVDGFVAHLLTFMAVEVVDIRPLTIAVPGLTFVQDDAVTLASFAAGSVPSLSSLHAVEHMGLGRYGDRVDPDGADRAMRSFARVLEPGGVLYFSVPVGRPRIEFNAHRVFDASAVQSRLMDLGLACERFAMIDDSGTLRPDASPSDANAAEYACGIFILRRKG